MTGRLAKWQATVSIAWQTLTAYRMNFILLVLGPALVFFFIKVSIWSSVYAMGNGADVGGMSEAGMLSYQCYVLVISLLGQSYQSTELSEDIRLGRITSHLLHPFSFFEFHAAHWVAFQLLQLLVTGVLLGLAVATGYVPPPAPADLLAGVAFTTLVSVLWFAFHFSIGMMAFWLEQTWVLRIILKDVGVFLSGAFLPLEFYPGWLRELLLWTPFPYMTWIPAKIFAGEYEGIPRAVLVVVVWAGLAWAFAAYLWRRGLRLYSAAGM